MDILSDFTTGMTASRATRYTLDPARTLTLTTDTSMERIGPAVLTSKPDAGAWLVHEHGNAQQALPLRAVANAVCTGAVIPFDAIATLLVRTGKATEFKAAIDAALKDAKDAAGA